MSRPPPPRRKGSGLHPRLRDKLVAYFARNEEEVLCISDIVLKFGVDQSTAQSSVRFMEQCGLLTVQKSRMTAPMFISAGPALLQVIRGTR